MESKTEQIVKETQNPAQQGKIPTVEVPAKFTKESERLFPNKQGNPADNGKSHDGNEKKPA